MKIQIYTADVGALKDESQFNALMERVSASRRRKVRRLKNAQDKRLALGAEGLLLIACESFGADFGEIVEDENGKPRFTEGPHFSLSHSGERAMCAISDCPVGCDIERMREVPRRIARKYFSKEEAEAIGDDRELFFRYWTMKESYMKCTGLGFKIPLGSFSVDLSGRVKGTDEYKEEYKIESRVEGDYALAWCVKNTKEN